MTNPLRVASAIALATVAGGVWVITADATDPGAWALWGRWSPAGFAANLALGWICVWGARALLTQRPRRALGELALATAGLGVAVIGVEISALAGVHYGTVLPLPEEVMFTRVKPWNNPANLRDPQLIFRHRPGLRFTGSVPGDLVPLYGIATERRYPVDVRYDSRGFRNPADVDRAEIVLIGDSFLEAGLVAIDDLVSQKLGRALGVSTANLGVSGYGPQQELVVLNRYGFPLQPRLVLWFFFEGNDLIDVGRYRRFRADPENTLRSGDRFRERSFTGNALRWIAARTTRARDRDAELARSRSCRYRAARSEAEERFYFAFEGHPLERADLQHLALAQQVIASARQQCRKRGIEFALIYVPTKFRVFEPVCEIERGSVLADWSQHDLPQRMAHFAAEQGVSFLDLTSEFRTAAAVGVAAHFPDDGHWNASGHELAARALARFLQQEVGFSPR